MLDDDTVIRIPHAATVSREGGHKHVQIDDPRTMVAMQEQGATLTLFFNREDGELAEIRLSAPADGRFEPWRLMPQVPLHVKYARAAIAGEQGHLDVALHALRQIGASTRRGSRSRRGLSDDFLRLIAQIYKSLMDEGEPYPIRTIAELEPVDISTASRWVTAARTRGFLPAKDQEKSR